MDATQSRVAKHAHATAAVVEALGGTFALESPAPGGSRLRAEIPSRP